MRKPTIMLAAKQLDDEIAEHLAQLNIQQKQIVLVVLKTMSGQNSIANINNTRGTESIGLGGLKREKVN